MEAKTSYFISSLFSIASDPIKYTFRVHVLAQKITAKRTLHAMRLSPHLVTQVHRIFDATGIME